MAEAVQVFSQSSDLKRCGKVAMAEHDADAVVGAVQDVGGANTFILEVR